MEKNLTSGKEWKVITAFAVPLLISNLMQVCYNLTDSIIVANAIGENALGAIGVTSAFVWLLSGIATGFGAGINIAVSQYFGANKKEDIHSTVHMGFFLSLLLGVLITIICFVIADPVIRGFLGTPDSMLNDAKNYFLIYCIGIVFQMIYNAAYGILRAQGDSKGALLFLVISAIINIGLDLLFILSFGWGVGGAAAATILSQAGAALAAFIYLQKLFPQIRFRIQAFHIDLSKIKLIFKLSIPIVIQSSVMSGGFIILQRLVNSFGEASITGFAAMQKVEMFLHIPSNSFAMALTSFTGQNVGAGKLDRVRKGYRSTLILAFSICLAIVLCILPLSRQIMGIFNLTDVSMQRALEHLYVVSAFIFLTTCNNITSGLLQGAGDVRVPAIGGFANLGIRILLAFYMAGTVIDFRSIYFSLPPAWITGCAITAGRYLSGKWRRHTIV